MGSSRPGSVPTSSATGGTWPRGQASPFLWTGLKSAFALFFTAPPFWAGCRAFFVLTPRRAPRAAGRFFVRPKGLGLASVSFAPPFGLAAVPCLQPMNLRLALCWRVSRQGAAPKGQKRDSRRVFSESPSGWAAKAEAAGLFFLLVFFVGEGRRFFARGFAFRADWFGTIWSPF